MIILVLFTYPFVEFFLIDFLMTCTCFYSNFGQIPVIFLVLKSQHKHVTFYLALWQMCCNYCWDCPIITYSENGMVSETLLFLILFVRIRCYLLLIKEFIWWALQTDRCFTSVYCDSWMVTTVENWDKIVKCFLEYGTIRRGSCYMPQSYCAPLIKSY
jgi:hypothetical protein